VNEIRYPAVVAYIQNDAGLLLSVTRKGTGEDAAPGGKCYPNESLRHALCRETREETNVELVHWRLVYDAQHLGRRVFAYLAIEWRGVPEALEYGTRIAWVTPEALANGFGAEYHRRALRAAKLLH
jgi:ADP-ribose pyrophosphatase YjhB (NUDIX family)